MGPRSDASQAESTDHLSYCWSSEGNQWLPGSDALVAACPMRVLSMSSGLIIIIMKCAIMPPILHDCPLAAVTFVY